MARVIAFGRAGARSRGRRRARPPIVEPILALIAVCALGYVAIEKGYVAVPGLDVAAGMQRTAVTDTVTRRFSLCAAGGDTCVVDGDTIRIDGVSVRIADIDTPEVFSHQCPAELALGEAATRRMLSLVNQGGFEMAMWDSRDEDVYGRKLRVLTRDGQSLGMVLVAEGLARPWDGARRSWCG